MNIKHFISIKIKQIPICLKSNFSLHHVRWIGVFHLMDINVILPKHFLDLHAHWKWSILNTIKAVKCH